MISRQRLWRLRNELPVARVLEELGVPTKMRDGYLRFLVAARLDTGGFHANYDARGEVSGHPSPYYDGEALLALVKAARYLGRDYVEDRDVAAPIGYASLEFHCPNVASVSSR